jgi:hypothetical protein
MVKGGCGLVGCVAGERHDDMRWLPYKYIAGRDRFPSASKFSSRTRCTAPPAAPTCVHPTVNWTSPDCSRPTSTFSSPRPNNGPIVTPRYPLMAR